MNKPCPYSKQLSAMIDGELPEDLAIRMQQHIEECKACKEEYGRLSTLDMMLAGMVDIEPSGRFEPEFWRKINLLKDKKKKRWSFLDYASWGFRPSLAFAAAVAAIFAVIKFSGEQKIPQWNPVEFSISSDLEFYRDMDMIDHLDLLENWDEIMSIRESAI